MKPSEGGKHCRSDMRCKQGHKEHEKNPFTYSFQQCRIYSFHVGLQYGSETHLDFLDLRTMDDECTNKEMVKNMNATRLVHCERRVICFQKSGRTKQLCKYLIEQKVMGKHAEREAALYSKYHSSTFSGVHHINLLLLRKF